MEFRYRYARHTLGNLSALGLLKTSAQDKINPVLSSLHLFLSPPQCDQILRNFTTLAKLSNLRQVAEGLFSVWQNFGPTLATLFCF